jgi:ribonuclease HI
LRARLFPDNRHVMLKLFFDGGCRPNPGAMEAAVVVAGITHHWPALGHGDNNDAEWRALIHAAHLARSLGAADIVLIGDSAMVIGQARGAARCRTPAFAAYREAFETIVGDVARVRLRRVARSHNLAGIALDRIRAGLADATLIVRS